MIETVAFLGQRLVSGLFLRDATWQVRTLRNKHSIFILFDDDTESQCQMTSRVHAHLHAQYQHSAVEIL